MTHILQTAWHDVAAEQAYIAEIKHWIEAGELDRAAEKLLADIEDIGSTLAHPAKKLARNLEIDGWDEMVEAIAEFEGDPITAVHLILSNEEDLSFEDRESIFEPELEVALYTDEFYPFSEGDRDTLFAESQLTDRPWFGQGEDIEVFLELLEMGNFNTSLLRHKRQYYFRDEMHELDKLNGMADDIAPLPYIEFMLCAMYRAVAFHRLVRDTVAQAGLPNNIPVLAGMHNMKFEVTSVYFPKQGAKVKAKEMADLVIPIKRNVIPEPEPVVEATAIRKVFQDKEPDLEKRGLLKRFFAKGNNAA